MAQVLVRNLDVRVVEKLKGRAKRHGRSLQAEMKLVLEQAAAAEDGWALAARIRKRLAGRIHSDSAELIAEDRQR